MIYQQTTQVPNQIFSLLPTLTEAELKIILTVIRQTIGWQDKRTGKRKMRDRITSYQFIQKTGLAKRTVTKAIQNLLQKHLLVVTDYAGMQLTNADERKGKSYLYYSLFHPVHNHTQTNAQDVPTPVHKSNHNKTNYQKISKTKLRQDTTGHIKGLLPSLHSIISPH